MNIRLSISNILSLGVAIASLNVAASASAGECEGILGYIQDKTDWSSSGKHYSSYDRLFCSDEYSSYGQARDAGLKVGVPIEGIPLEFGGHNRESSWGNYRKTFCDAIRTDNFSSADLRLTIQKGNEAAIAAWKTCVTSAGFHFYAESDSADDMQFVLRAKYNPDGPYNETRANGPVTFQPAGNVECQGDAIIRGTKIGPGGLLLNCRRKSKSAMTIALSTQNGPGIVKLREAQKGPPSCPSLQTKVFSVTGAADQHPRVEVKVDSGYKIVGGGAMVNWNGAGNLLTSSYPENQTTWVATSKDHSIESVATITAWALAIHDPNDNWIVSYISNTGDITAHPQSRATLPAGYSMTGGGARVNWTGAGNLLTASYPVDGSTWEARSKDHSVPSPATVTAYVIGIKARHCVGNKPSQVFSSETGVAAHSEGMVSVPNGFVLTGGGARVNWTGAGNLLTASYPQNQLSWGAKSKDHSIASPASITVYAIGIPH